MNLNFRGLDLRSFDACKLHSDVEASKSSMGLTSHSVSASESDSSLLSDKLFRVVRTIDLSSNRLRSFSGLATLRHLTVLNLSHNALSTLTTSCLPAQLEMLNVSHNRLSTFGNSLSRLTRLSELRARCNELTSTGVTGLPPSLHKLDVSHNRLTTTTPLTLLNRLAVLDVSHNAIDSIDAVEPLYGLRSLRSLDLRGNPVATQFTLRPLLTAHLPRLGRLDGVLLVTVGAAKASRPTVTSYSDVSNASRALSALNMSSAEVIRHKLTSSSSSNNNTSKLSSGDVSGERRLGSTSHSVLSCSRLDSVCVADHHPGRSANHPRHAPSLPIQRMNIRIGELRRMLDETEELERLDHSRHALLTRQIKHCAGVITSQANELELVRADMERLNLEKAALSDPAKKLERTFEHTHASLVAHRSHVARR